MVHLFLDLDSRPSTLNCFGSAGLGIARWSDGSRAAVSRADIVAGGKPADSTTFSGAGKPFPHQFTQHTDKLRMRPDRRGANHVQAKFRRDILRLLVKVVQYFKMVGQETDGHDNNLLDTLLLQ